MARPKQQAVQYETSIMRLGCLTTATWSILGLLTFIALFAAFFGLGLGPWVSMGLGGVAVLGVRQVTLVGYRRIRTRLRQRRHAALTAAEAHDTGHLPEPLAAIVHSGRALAQQIDMSRADPESVIANLAAWLRRVAALDVEQRRELDELGLVTSDLVPLTRLRRNPGELADLWNERAYRRLQAVLPVLQHFDRQLCRARDDVYR